MKNLKGFKIQGTGNDFLLFDLTEKSQPPMEEHLRAAFVKRVCHRNLGIGADGVVFIFKIQSQKELTWDFYNNDGSPANMCGNATRCVGRWAFDKKGLKSPITLITGAGKVKIENGLPNISVQMPAIEFQDKNFKLNIQGRELTCDIINSGVPHAVFFRPHLHDHLELRVLSNSIRAAGVLNPPAANITFVASSGYDQADTTTFERGVNEFTLSCGTGALAAAFALLQKSPQVNRWQMHVPGGDLTVDFSGPQPLLIGPAEIIGSLEIPVL